MLRQTRAQPSTSPWRWEKTIVGVISNSDDRVPSVLASLGLNVQPRRVGSKIRRIAESEDISFVVHSYDVGFEKPDRRIFNAATGILGSSLGSVDDYQKLYVGDSVSNDYIGAEKAGWHAVLIDRHDPKGGREAEAERKAPLETKSVEVADGRMKKVKVIRGLAELVNWNPKNKWTGERDGRSKSRAKEDSASSGEEA